MPPQGGIKTHMGCNHEEQGRVRRICKATGIRRSQYSGQPTHSARAFAKVHSWPGFLMSHCGWMGRTAELRGGRQAPEGQR